MLYYIGGKCTGPSVVRVDLPELAPKISDLLHVPRGAARRIQAVYVRQRLQNGALVSNRFIWITKYLLSNSLTSTVLTILADTPDWRVVSSFT
ncbi:hypothetical protein J6590_073150 [Homalodisca vitripennis]|nr:hypothetical protein J6590_073150 [Homalodisca vitripennis]